MCPQIFFACIVTQAVGDLYGIQVWTIIFGAFKAKASNVQYWRLVFIDDGRMFFVDESQAMFKVRDNHVVQASVQIN